jgi:hypothetical protein
VAPVSVRQPAVIQAAIEEAEFPGLGLEIDFEGEAPSPVKRKKKTSEISRSDIFCFGSRTFLQLQYPGQI